MSDEKKTEATEPQENDEVVAHSAAEDEEAAPCGIQFGANA